MGFKGLSSTAGAHGGAFGAVGKRDASDAIGERDDARGNCAGLAVGMMRAG